MFYRESQHQIIFEIFKKNRLGQNKSGEFVFVRFKTEEETGKVERIVCNKGFCKRHSARQILIISSTLIVKFYSRISKFFNPEIYPKHNTNAHAVFEIKNVHDEAVVFRFHQCRKL